MATYTLTKLSSMNIHVYRHVRAVISCVHRPVCAQYTVLLHPRYSGQIQAQRKAISRHKYHLHTSISDGTLHSNDLLTVACAKYLSKHYLYSRPVHTYGNILTRSYHWANCNSSAEKVSSCVCNCHNIASKSSRFSWTNRVYRAYLESLLGEMEVLQERRQQDKSTHNDHTRSITLLPIAMLVSEIKGQYDELDELRTLLEDIDMRSMAEEDSNACHAAIEEMEAKLYDLLTSESVVDDHDIMLEVSSGAGGQEAMLFASEVFDMYAKFAAYKGWRFELEKENIGERGGLRFGSATVSGHNVFHTMKFESGIHRVQRVPATMMRTGRVHTSTVSVVIIPQSSEIDVVLNPKDLKVDTYNSQYVKKMDNAVRITHLPTGTVATFQDSRSQIENKACAFKVLRSRIYNNQLAKQQSKEHSQRKLQTGNKDRSEKIRTYNFNQDRITDHRLGENFYGMDEFMGGAQGLDTMIQGLHIEARKESLEITMEEFEENKKKVKRSKRQQ